MLRHHALLTTLGTDLWDTVTLRGISTLWFLPTLFFAVCIWLQWLADSSKGKLLYIIAVPFVCWGFAVLRNRVQADHSGIWVSVIDAPYLTVTKSIAAAWFVAVGAELRRISKIIQKRGRISIVLILTAILSVLLSRVNRGIDFNHLRLGNLPVLYFVNGFISGVFVLLLLKCAEQHFSLRLLCWIGRNSLFIMATHLPFGLCSVLNKVADKVKPVPEFSAAYVMR